jgi:hypothetical protein
MSNGNGKVDGLEEAFRLREGSIQDPGLRELYDVVVERLRADAAQRSTFGALEQLMVERVAHFYIWVRDREIRGVGAEGVNPDDPTHVPGFVHEKVYRDTLALLFDTMVRLQRAEAREQPDASFIRGQALAQIGAVIAAECDAMHPDVGQPLKERFIGVFEKINLDEVAT